MTITLTHGRAEDNLHEAIQHGVISHVTKHVAAAYTSVHDAASGLLWVLIEGSRMNTRVMMVMV